MNLKKAKALRRKARELMVEFVKDKVLEKSLTDGEKSDILLQAVPPRIHMRKHFTIHNALGTQRWWYRKVKHNPSLTYEEAIKEMYGE